MLNTAQKYSVGKLNFFGYKLLFVREKENKAFMCHNEKVILIEQTGNIIFNPNIVIR
jgi:hypothetical protein